MITIALYYPSRTLSSGAPHGAQSMTNVLRLMRIRFSRRRLKRFFRTIFPQRNLEDL